MSIDEIIAEQLAAKGINFRIVSKYEIPAYVLTEGRAKGRTAVAPESEWRGAFDHKPEASEVVAPIVASILQQVAEQQLSAKPGHTTHVTLRGVQVIKSEDATPQWLVREYISVYTGPVSRFLTRR